ncbi:MAG: TlpA family protein disulfide reductase [Pirellula sp.]|jgi:thiol-disulfide isomerase/thioredoxin|nr:TlpA family protein disulfide reductase [Pirellula sp.]
MHSLQFFIGLIVGILCEPILLSNDPAPSQTTPRGLDGKWLLESVLVRQQDSLEQFWWSVVTVSSDSFSVTNFLDPSKELKGKIRLDDKSPSHLDIELEELDFSSLGEPLKIEASTLKGILQFDNEDAMTIAINTSPIHDRPAKWESTKSVVLIRLRRAPKGFENYPSEVAIQVETADGKPAQDAVAARFHSKRLKGNQPDTPWTFSEEKRTDSNGIVVFPYTKLPRLIVDESTKQIAFLKLSPGSLIDGKIKVQLAPACEVRGTIISEELAKAGQPIGWTNVYLEAEGNSFAYCSSEHGAFDFRVPAGKYQLNAYGSNLSRRTVDFSVSPNQTEMTVDPISLKPKAIALLKGKPAPELMDVTAWSSEPLKLSNMKGQYVLVDFWGYWCGPCVHDMPVLIELHEKFGGKGLAIVGIHVDLEGEVDSKEKLKEQTSIFVNGIWQGKELPFPNAMISGEVVGEGDSRRRSGTILAYGIEAFPTTILIDPNGNVVDEFSCRDIKQATEKIEKLLKELK